MINPVSVRQVTFKADDKTRDKNGEYTDPLMHWPLRGAAFTNEVGEALRPLIGNFANLSWIPALTYIGADVYDKYKNDKNEYSPNSKRCLKQAVFQGMASIFLPLIAVKVGQDTFSQIGKLTSDKLSINSQEYISETAVRFIENGKLKIGNGEEDTSVKDFTERVLNNLDFKHQETKTKNPILKTFITIEEKMAKLLNINKTERQEIFAKKTIRDIIQVNKQILNPDDKFKASSTYINYQKFIKDGQSKNVALKSTLKKYQQSKSLKGRFIKTIGGFIALGCAIQPIDRFVDHVLIGKYVGPQIDKIPTQKTKSSLRITPKED